MSTEFQFGSTDQYDREPDPRSSLPRTGGGRDPLDGSGRGLSEEARDNFLETRGLSLRSLDELRAVLAYDAIASGAISLRIFDRDLALERFGRTHTMLHAKLFISDAGALAGSANDARGARYPPRGGRPKPFRDPLPPCWPPSGRRRVSPLVETGFRPRRALRSAACQSRTAGR